MTASPRGPEDTPLFRDVDRGDASRLVAMMDATDRWSAVVAARSWVLDEAGAPDRPAIDVGCGPATFSDDARRRGWSTVDVDRSWSMVAVARARHHGAPVVVGDLAHLPTRSASAGLVHCERALQWTAEPGAAIDELWRLVAPEGVLAITDTDWGTLVVDHLEADAGGRLGRAALAWVPHPRFARSLAHHVAGLGATSTEIRSFEVVLSAWDPDDPSQVDGPPGLPLRTIAAAAAPGDRLALDADLATLAEQARAGMFHASLTLITTVARR